MSEFHEIDLPAYLSGGRRLLQQTSELYGRLLSPAEYWWLGVALAASTLAELSGRSYATGRMEQLVDRLGHKGVRGDWLQRFVEELAELDAEGLLWPVYERSPEGPVQETGVAVHAGFDGETAYFLALAHIGVALAVHRERQAVVEALAAAIIRLIESGPAPGDEALILESLRPPAF